MAVAAAKAVAVVVVAILTEILKHILLLLMVLQARLHPPHLFGPFIHKDGTLVVVVAST